MVVNGSPLPNLPWEECSVDCRDIVWRSKQNPIITRDAVPDANSIFNSAVVPFEDGFAGVFRCDDTARIMQLHAGTSRDGIHWAIEPQRIQFQCADDEIGKFVYGYDPRVCWIDDRYYVTWCNGYHGPTIGVGYTFDFKTFHQIENAFLPYNRNGVLFPRKINGKFAMLSRPSDTGHTPFGDIFYSTSPDMEHWGHHRFVMGPKYGWQSTKVGGGPMPIETSEGWLIFYHGVITSCNGFEYSFGAALLDLEQPWQVMYRTAPYLMAPREMYERVGDTPNVVFPCAALVDAPTNRIAIYYGAADTVVALAFARVDQVIEFVKSHSEL
ncbi:MAG: glycoside hydrolase family 130 protein [Chloroflexi bacterium]|nr:glycoside hydrolase family 130 protein [Chloroflexota bacterium]